MTAARRFDIMVDLLDRSAQMSTPSAPELAPSFDSTASTRREYQQSLLAKLGTFQIEAIVLCG